MLTPEQKKTLVDLMTLALQNATPLGLHGAKGVVLSPKLVLLAFDPTGDLGPSASGKTIGVCNTGGFASLSLAENVGIGINLLVTKPKK